MVEQQMERVPDITTEQLFCKRGLGFLWANRNLIDPGQLDIVKALYNNKKTGSMVGKQKVTYNLKNTGGGRLGYGRIYGTKGSLETLERECRGTICQAYYYDIDIVNCHPVLLLQIAKNKYNKELPEVQTYCDDRDTILKAISANREEAKQEVLKVFFGGITTSPLLKAMSVEIRGFAKFLSTVPEYAQLWEFSSKQDNKFGSFLSFILQTEERHCMLAMKSSLEKIGWSVDVLCYDGVMVRKTDKLELTMEMMSLVEKDILRETGYDVSILSKKFQSYEIPAVKEEIVLGVPMDDYTKMKEEFEETHFYYVPGNCIAEVLDGDISMYALEHAHTYFQNKWNFKKSEWFKDTESFIKLWLKDPKRRDIYMIDLKPSDNPRVYSPPLQFNYLKGDKVDDPIPYISTFTEYINQLIPDVQSRGLLLEWLSQLLNEPFVNPTCGVVMTGCMGGGKDFLGYLIGTHILGSLYYKQYGSNTQFWEKHDVGRQNKFFVQLEEVDGAISKRNESEMKSRLTEPTCDFNHKNGKIITCGNYNRYYYTTNDPQAIPMTNEERRWIVINSSRLLVGRYDFFGKMADLFHNPSGARVLAEYIKSIPYGKFPKPLVLTETARSMIDTQSTPLHRFIDAWDGLRCSARDLFNKYRDFCMDQHLFYSNNATVFYKNMVKYRNNGRVNFVTSSNIIYYFKNDILQTPEIPPEIPEQR